MPRKKIPPVTPRKKYPNGPQGEKERLWRMDRKAFIRKHILREG